MKTRSVEELLRDAPTNWGKWGEDDEIGALNYLKQESALEGVACVQSGVSFTLGLKLGHPDGDPIFPGRHVTHRYTVADRAQFEANKWQPLPGGLEFADDVMVSFLQAGTHVDALGHMWCGDGRLYNGYDANTTNGGLAKASVTPLGEHGMVARGVLLDVARHRNKSRLDPGETLDHADLIDCASTQCVELRPGTVLLIRTGWIGRYYEVGREAFFDDFREPGLTYSSHLVRWFQELEIPNLVTDTLANEATIHPESGVMLPLHIALMRNLGVVFTEAAWLDDLADHCAADSRYEFLYAAAPLKIVGGSGSMVNPIVIR